MMPIKTYGTYSIECHDVVSTVEFCPFEWSCHLIVIGTADRAIVGSVRFQDENPEINGVEFKSLREFHHGPRVNSISWSPETSILTMPKVVKFCTAGADNKVRLFTSDVLHDDKVEVLCEHRDYVNDVCMEPDRGQLVASVSDDHTCRLTDLSGAQVACFPLGAPGVNVSWPKEETGKLMVAEKKGVIRFYNVQTHQPIMSLDGSPGPLLCADVSPRNPLAVAAVTGSDVPLFDTSRSSRPVELIQAHSDGCGTLRWSRAHEHLLATCARPGAQLKVFNVRTGQVLLQSELTVANGLSWHLRLPIVAVGGDKQVHFWLAEAV